MDPLKNEFGTVSSSKLSPDEKWKVPSYVRPVDNFSIHRSFKSPVFS